MRRSVKLFLVVYLLTLVVLVAIHLIFDSTFLSFFMALILGVILGYLTPLDLELRFKTWAKLKGASRGDNRS